MLYLLRLNNEDFIWCFSSTRYGTSIKENRKLKFNASLIAKLKQFITRQGLPKFICRSECEAVGNEIFISDLSDRRQLISNCNREKFNHPMCNIHPSIVKVKSKTSYSTLRQGLRVGMNKWVLYSPKIALWST